MLHILYKAIISICASLFLISMFTFAIFLPSSNEAGAVTPVLNEIQKILPSDGEADDEFGHSVSISGDRAIVGAYSNDDNGSAYVYERDGTGNWVEVDELTASDGESGDEFGISVSISGDRAIVGARVDDDNGSAYIYERDVTGNWVQVDKLTASDGEAGANFGISVSISGDKAIVGAYVDDDNGSAYVFERDGMGDWVEVEKLTASDGASSDYFGWSVSVNGDRAIVGAYGDDDNDPPESGSAYVFERDVMGDWVEVEKLTASDAARRDFFGYSVSISGDKAIVGAHGDDFSGSAYIFERDGTGDWVEVDKLMASDGSFGDNFGWGVSVYGERAIVGARLDNAKGSAYVFERDETGDWGEVEKLKASDGASGDDFGFSVSVYGDRAIVGARWDVDNGVKSGSAYIFEFSNPKELMLNSDAGDAGADIDINSVEVTQTESTLDCMIEVASGTDGLTNRSMFQCRIDFDDFEDEGVSGCDANGDGVMAGQTYNIGSENNGTCGTSDIELSFRVMNNGGSCTGLPSVVCSEEEVDADGNPDDACDGHVDEADATFCYITISASLDDVADIRDVECPLAGDCLTDKDGNGDYDVFMFFRSNLRNDQDRLPNTDDNRDPNELDEVGRITLTDPNI
jgi:hypothetical protein